MHLQRTKEVLVDASVLFCGPLGHCWMLPSPGQAPRGRALQEDEIPLQFTEQEHSRSIERQPGNHIFWPARVLVAEAKTTADNKAATVCLGPGQNCDPCSQLDMKVFLACQIVLAGPGHERRRDRK